MVLWSGLRPWLSMYAGKTGGGAAGWRQAGAGAAGGRQAVGGAAGWRQEEVLQAGDSQGEVLQAGDRLEEAKLAAMGGGLAVAMGRAGGQRIIPRCPAGRSLCITSIGIWGTALSLKLFCDQI